MSLNLKPNYKQIAQSLGDFVNTPTPSNDKDYKQVCETLLAKHNITSIFGTLIASPQSFRIISGAIIKLFKSPLGGALLRDSDVVKWIISGLKQSSSIEYKSLNILTIDILLNGLQTDSDIEYWITTCKSTLFLWSLSLISSPFESSFQKLEKLILKHSTNKLLLKTLFSQNIIKMLLNIKNQTNNNKLNYTDKGTMNFRCHALWIGALQTYYTTDNQNNIIKNQANNIMTNNTNNDNNATKDDDNDANNATKDDDITNNTNNATKDDNDANNANNDNNNDNKDDNDDIIIDNTNNDNNVIISNTNSTNNTNDPNNANNANIATNDNNIIINNTNDNDIDMKDNNNVNMNVNDPDPSIISLYISSSLFNSLLDLLSCNDILIQINVLPLLSKLSTFYYGLKLLLDSNIIQILNKLLQSDDVILFGKEIYKLFVNMIRNTKKISASVNNIDAWLDPDNCTQIFNIISEGFKSFDISVLESCSLFLGFYCSFNKILKKVINLNSNNKPTDILYKNINQLSHNPSSDVINLAIASLHALCEIFSVLSDNNSDICLFQLNILFKLNGMNKLFKLIKHPDDEMRFSSFRLINCISKQEWGIELINECAGLFEYLTDRNDPDIMMGYKWKYTIIESMFKNQNTPNILNNTHLQHIKQYIERGVVFRTNKKNISKKKITQFQIGTQQL